MKETRSSRSGEMGESGTILRGVEKPEKDEEGRVVCDYPEKLWVDDSTDGRVMITIRLLNRLMS